MKTEKKHLYALTKREAGAALDACNRITADSPQNLGIRDSQFEACDQAAFALARPEIDADKKLLVFTAREFEQLFRCFINGSGDGDFIEAFCRTAAERAAFGRVQEKLRELWKKKN